MKKRINILVTLVCLLALGLAFIGCENDPKPNSPIGGGYTSYASADSTNIYLLEITENASARAAYSPQTGDKYVLTIVKIADGTSKKSTGTVQSAAGELKLKPSTGDTFTVNVSGSNIGSITGSIKLDNESTPITAPSSLSPITDTKDTDLNGSWRTGNGAGDNVFTYDNGSFSDTYKNVPTQKGTYTTANIGGKDLLMETITHIYGNTLHNNKSLPFADKFVETQWYSKADILAIVGNSYSDEIRDAFTTHVIIYSITGDSMSWKAENESETRMLKKQ